MTLFKIAPDFQILSIPPTKLPLVDPAKRDVNPLNKIVLYILHQR